MSNTTTQVFQAKQAKTIEALQSLADFLKQGIELGVEIEEMYIQKVQQAIKEKESEKLRVALIGGFSEGKTSVAAAWLERVQKDMKIDIEESSDSITIYDVDDEIELIDTPGLFGFKESENGEKYKDKTKKYISEAHIILYVMDSVNPIKESHTPTLQWLFNKGELNLLGRTIFILSKFDEVADIEDEKEYAQLLESKRKDVLKGLARALGQEQQNIKLVAIAANPYDKGIEYWLEHKEEFRSLSHITSLQEATKETIQASGGKELVIQEAKQSILADVVHNKLPTAQKMRNAVSEERRKLQKVIDATSKDLQRLYDDINAAQMALRGFVTRYFSSLRLQVEGCSLETINRFVIEEIGSSGENINAKIKNEFQKHIGPINAEINKISSNLETSLINFEESIAAKYGAEGAKWLKNSGVINATNIKLARDGIVTIAKTLGINLKDILKFNPWGAVNLAAKANVVLVVLGLGLELWDTWKQIEKEKKFQEAKKQMSDNFDEQKKKLLEIIDSEDFVTKFFPQAAKLQEFLEELQKEEARAQEQDKAFEEWVEKGQNISKEIDEIIDVEIIG